MKIKNIAFSILLIVLALSLMNNTQTCNNIFEYFNLHSTTKHKAGLDKIQIRAPKIPSSLSFAGEPVPLDDWEIRERLDRELIVNCNLHSATIFYIKRANRFFPTIEKILAENNVPDDFKYLCVAESGLDNVVSPAGASGFWQFMRNTASVYGLVVNNEIDERYNLEKSTHAACKYLIQAKSSVGSWTAAAAGYNMGIAGVQTQIAKQNENSYYNLFLNTETSRYVFRILALKTIYENQNQYGFYLDKEDLYTEIKTKDIAVNGAVDWIEFAKNNNITYKDLRRLNPWIREPKMQNAEKRTFQVKILN